MPSTGRVNPEPSGSLTNACHPLSGIGQVLRTAAGRLAHLVVALLLVAHSVRDGQGARNSRLVRRPLKAKRTCRPLESIYAHTSQLAHRVLLGLL